MSALPVSGILPRTVSATSVAPTSACNAAPMAVTPARARPTTIALVVEARITEIADAIWKAIQRSGVADDLGAGLILAGNASKLRNLDQLLQTKTNLPVRIGSHSRFLEDGTNTHYHDIAFAPSIGLLLTADKDCLYKIPAQPDVNGKGPKIKRDNKFDKIRTKLTNNIVGLFKYEESEE